MADNFYFKIVSSERDHLAMATKLVCHRHRTAVAWSLTPARIPLQGRGTMIRAGALALYWSMPPEPKRGEWDGTVGGYVEKPGMKEEPKYGVVQKLPYEMGAEPLAEFIWGWLKSVDYGHEPDIDGSCGKGFEVGMPTDHSFWQLMLIVEPEWMEYHK